MKTKKRIVIDDDDITDEELDEVLENGEADEEIVTTSEIQLQRILVELKGLPPGLLMSSRRGMAPEEERNKPKANRTPDEEADLAAYWIEGRKGKQLAIPWEHLYMGAVKAASYFKFKGSKKMTEPVAATISCEQELIPITAPRITGELAEDAKARKFAKYGCYRDSRWGRIPPKTGGLVMLHRMKVPEWSASFVITVDSGLYSPDLLKDIFAYIGRMIGIANNRPERKGPHGKFIVTNWEMVD